MNRNQTPSQNIYDEYYFKHACGGHTEFTASKGEKLSPWMEKILKIANLKPNDKVLDLGTGRGEIAYQSAKRNCFSVGLDYAMAAMDIAKMLRGISKEKSQEFVLILSDARYLPFKPEQFDIVFMLDIVEHLSPEDLQITLKQVHQCLKFSGRLIIHTMPNYNYYKYGYPVYRSVMNLFGNSLPKDPRERFYHGEVHVNIQTPKSLRASLINAGFETINIKLTQLSGSFFKIIFCRLFPLKYIIANDIIAIARKR